MLRKILGTVGTRLLIAVLTLVIIILNARILGPEKVGTISLVILAVTIIQLLNSFVGGGALVYLVPRHRLLKLIVPAYLWAVITAIAGSFILDFFRFIPSGTGLHLYIIPDGYLTDVMLLSLLLSLSSVNFMLLMGQERIGVYNAITLFQILFLFGSLIFFFFLLDLHEISAYIRSLYISYFAAFILGFAAIVRSIRQQHPKGSDGALKEIFRYGSVMQLGNILQFLNYRVSYYFIEFFLNRAAVGIYSVGVQLSESIWLVAKSIHMVQFTRISNEEDPQYGARLTLNLLKITFLLTLVCLVSILVLLHLFFSLIFKPAFNEVPAVMVAMATGILVFSVSIILSPYFSGTGKPIHNSISAAIGLVFTILFSLLLIPAMGITGAAWAAAMSYTAATCYQIVVFLNKAKVTGREFLLTRGDIRTLSGIIRKAMKREIREQGKSIPGEL